MAGYTAETSAVPGLRHRCLRPHHSEGTHLLPISQAEEGRTESVRVWEETRHLRRDKNTRVVAKKCKRVERETREMTAEGVVGFFWRRSAVNQEEVMVAQLCEQNINH